MKQTKYILIAILLTGFVGCKKNLLDTTPTNLLTKEQIYGSPAGVLAYFASLYRDMPIEDYAFCNGRFGQFPGDGHSYTANWADECFNNNSSTLHEENWGNLYKAIRNVNTFLKEVTEVDISDDLRNRYIAEARFVRAYYYFGLVKFYGGVPLLLEPQEAPKGGNTQELMLPRNKEVEIWDQVKSDLDFAVANLPASSDYGRTNKYVALALLSRTMLHAASIGKYGTVQLDGVVGVDATKAAEYMNASYEASKTIITDQKYSLFNKYPTDKVKNFQYLFYEVKPGDANPEAILCKGYDFNATTRTHSQDLMVLPNYLRSGIGYANRMQPTLDLAEKFEYIDGRPGTLDIGAPGSYVHYATMNGPFIGKDPRFDATIVAPGTPFRGATVTGQRGVMSGGVEYNGTDWLQYFDMSTKKFTTSVTPIVGTGNSSYNTLCFWLKKWTDPVTDIIFLRDWTSRTSWLDMRLGEVLLNYAEAAIELGKPDNEALDAINQLRTRAGIPPHATIDLAKVRKERMVELAFENHAYWDYVRWRTLTAEFSLRQEYGLDIYYDADAGDYVFKRMPVGGGKTYQDRHYYFQVPGAERAKNQLLINNPGY